jgi:hypothetical protein
MLTNNRIEFSVRSARRLHNETLVIFGSAFQMRGVPDEEKWMQWQFQFSDKWIMVAAEAREQDSKLGLGAQKKTRRSACEELTCEYKSWFMCNIWGDLMRLILCMLRSVARRPLVKTKNSSAHATVNCRWCRREAVLYLLPVCKCN